MEKLEYLATTTICKMVLEWEWESEIFAEFNELANYFQHIPYHLVEDIRTVLVDADVYDADGFRLRPRAEQIALFVQDNIKKLSLPFYGREFSLNYLFHFSGSKLKNLEEFRLPNRCHLDNLTSRKMCELMPNLQILDLGSSTFDKGAMQFIVNLPLVKFYPGRSISELGIATLCGSNSKAKKTLCVLDIGNYKLPIECYHKVLYSMEKIEDFGGEHSKWFGSLPSELEKREFNLKELHLDSTKDLIDKELNIANRIFPKLTKIRIFTSNFTLRNVCNLVKFRKLKELDINVTSNLKTNVEDDSQLWEQTCLDNATCPSLTKLTFSSFRDSWIPNRYLFRLLEMCPRLDTLKLLNCYTFSDKTAAQLASLMVNKNLTHLNLIFCDLLGPIGVRELLKIPSLKELELYLIISKVVKRDFDSHLLHDDAKKYKVDLKLILTVNDSLI